jgi:hypothetical protein
VPGTCLRTPLARCLAPHYSSATVTIAADHLDRLRCLWQFQLPHFSEDRGCAQSWLIAGRDGSGALRWRVGFDQTLNMLATRRTLIHLIGTPKTD